LVGRGLQKVGDVFDVGSLACLQVGFFCLQRPKPAGNAKLCPMDKVPNGVLPEMPAAGPGLTRSSEMYLSRLIS
jgi:hypothetical protein